jgi:hypothetical protein
LKTFLDAYGKTPPLHRTDVWVQYIWRKIEQEQKKFYNNQVSVQLLEESVNVQQIMLVQGALVLLLFDTIAILI